MTAATAHFVPVTALDRALLERAAAWSPCLTLRELSVVSLNHLARREGLELATAVLYDRILRVAGNAGFFEQVQSAENRSFETIHRVGIVPGAFYREHKYTGADGTRIVEIAQELGCQTERVPIRSFGSLSENARIILDWLEAQTAKRVALVSLSKGSADVKAALGLPDAGEAFRCVTTWVSVSGIVQGTPLVAWLQKRPLRWLGVRLLLRFHGHRAAVMDDLRWEDGAPLASWPQIPVHLRVVHVFGFPLRRHLSHPWAPRAYERLSSLGPNDGGGNLLGDVTRFPGIVCPVWGADHYLGPGWDSRPLLRNILRTAMAEALS